MCSLSTVRHSSRYKAIYAKFIAGHGIKKKALTGYTEKTAGTMLYLIQNRKAL